MHLAFGDDDGGGNGHIASILNCLNFELCAIRHRLAVRQFHLGECTIIVAVLLMVSAAIAKTSTIFTNIYIYFEHILPCISIFG